MLFLILFIFIPFLLVSISHPTIQKIKSHEINEFFYNDEEMKIIKDFLCASIESPVSVEEFCNAVASISVPEKDQNDFKKMLLYVSIEEIYEILTDSALVGLPIAKIIKELNKDHFIKMFQARLAIERLVYAIILSEKQFPYEKYKSMTLAEALNYILAYFDLNQEQFAEKIGQSTVDELKSFLVRYSKKASKNEMTDLEYAKFLKDLASLKSRVSLFNQDRNASNFSILQLPTLVRGLKHAFGKGNKND